AALLYSAHRLNKLGQRARLKEVGDFFFRDRRRERAEVFAMFYVAVQVVAHHFVQRRRKDASRAETPRAKLLRASKPPDISSASQQLRPLVDQPLFCLDVLIIELAVVEHRFDFLVGILRSEKRVLHFVFSIAVAKKVVPYVERSSDAASRVAAGRLN